MNNQPQKTLASRDTLKKTMQQYRLANIANTNNFEELVTIKDRIQKITTALYMLTDLLDEKEILRQSIRTKSLEALSLINSYFINQDFATQNNSKLYYLLSEIKSYIDVGYYNRFFSEMNYSVIDAEIINLLDSFSSFSKNNENIQNKEEINTLFLQEKVFQIKEPEDKINILSVQKFDNKKNTLQKKTHIQKEVIKDTPVFVEKKTDLTKSYAASFLKKTQPAKRKKTVHKPKVNEAKEQRKKTILQVLTKKNNSSINDIYELFKDCSSKTIQRDINELIDEGLVVKHGSRRWSTYNLA